jgi:hypothetical protein
MLRVFGYLCYPNISATVKHKHRPRSLPCVFLGYPSQHRGYCCFDLVSGKILISRHVIFDECFSISDSSFDSGTTRALDASTPGLPLHRHTRSNPAWGPADGRCTRCRCCPRRGSPHAYHPCHGSLVAPALCRGSAPCRASTRACCAPSVAYRGPVSCHGSGS